MYLSINNHVKAKASAPWAKIFKLGIAAGCHIGFGSYLAITVGGACPAIAEANPGLQKVSKYFFMYYLTITVSLLTIFLLILCHRLSLVHLVFHLVLS